MENTRLLLSWFKLGMINAFVKMLQKLRRAYFEKFSTDIYNIFTIFFFLIQYNLVFESCIEQLRWIL